MARQINFSLYVDWAGDGSFSFNETNNLLSATGSEEMASPDDSVYASNGFANDADITLLNPNRRYSPTASPNVASGGILEHIQNGKFYGKRVRLYVLIDVTLTLLFQGGIKEISENARNTNSVGSVVLRCVSEDGFTINRRLNSPNSDTKSFYDTGKDEGELIARTLTLAGYSDGTHFVSQAYGGAGTKTIDRGLFTIPWYWLDGDSPIEDCWKLASACAGRFYYDSADGKFYYKNAQYLAFSPSSVIQETASETNCERVVPIYKDKELYKGVKITIRPRRIGEEDLLWEPDEVIRILPGETVTLNAKLNGPVYQFTELKVTITNTGGFPITQDVSIPAPTYYTQNVAFTITNNSIYHGFIREFKLIGRAIVGGETSVYEGQPLDTTYWSGRQGKERKVSDNPYIQTLAQGKAIADMLAHRQGGYNEEFDVAGYRGNKILRVGWRVRVLNTSLSINKEVIITSVTWRLDDDGLSQDFKGIGANNLYHYTPGDYFIIGTHSGNSSKRFFY